VARCYHINLTIPSDIYIFYSTFCPWREPCSESLGKNVNVPPPFNPQPTFNEISCILQQIYLILNASLMNWSQHWYVKPFRSFLAESKRMLEVVVSFNLCFCEVSCVASIECAWLDVHLRSTSALCDAGVRLLALDCNVHGHIWINQSNWIFWIYFSFSAYSSCSSAYVRPH